MEREGSGKDKPRNQATNTTAEPAAKPKPGGTWGLLGTALEPGCDQTRGVPTHEGTQCPVGCPRGG